MRNAAATFQCLANSVIKGITGCEVYIDDITVYSDTWSEHFERLNKLFSRLKESKLTVNLAKCEFAKTSINYLGHCVGNA